MKHTISILALTVTCLTTSVKASADTFYVDSIRYQSLSSNTCEVIEYYFAKYKGDIVIPEQVEYKPVNPKEQRVLYTVVGIGDEAFSRCEELTSISIPGSVTTIGNNAFENCTSLKYVDLGYVSAVFTRAFAKCPQLTNVVVSRGTPDDNAVLFGAEEAFEDSHIKNVEVPSDASLIPNRLFSPRSMVTVDTLTIATNKLTIECYEDEQWRTISPKYIRYAYGVTDATGHFESSNLCTIDFPESLIYVHATFTDCDSLESVTLPDGVIYIDSKVFKDCENLTDVHLPASLRAIPDDAFNKTAIQHIDIPDGVRTIGDGAFANSALNDVTLPKGITAIGNSAFSGCSSLERINIPESVTTIGEEAFYRCSSLESLSIPESVTSVGADAFSMCPLLI